jgi:hypothetical protein
MKIWSHTKIKFKIKVVFTKLIKVNIHKIVEKKKG